MRNGVIMGRIIAVCKSDQKGTAKKPVESAELLPGHGIGGDAHAGDWHRQVSLLATESVEPMRGKGAELPPGAFGENFLTEGIVLKELPVGTILKLSGSPVLKVTQIGKECHDRCAIYETVGDCVMPREGIFCKVVVGGHVRPSDTIIIGREEDMKIKGFITVMGGALSLEIEEEKWGIMVRRIDGHSVRTGYEYHKEELSKDQVASFIAPDYNYEWSEPSKFGNFLKMIEICSKHEDYRIALITHKDSGISKSKLIDNFKNLQKWIGEV